MGLKKLHKLILLFLTALPFLVSGCTPGQPKTPEGKAPALVQIAPSDYPDFSDDMAFDGLTHSLMQSISYLKRIPRERTFRFENDVFDTVHMINSLERFLDFIQEKPSGRKLKRFIASNYRVYRSTGRGNAGEVLFTGYYEPILPGSTKKTPDYRYPVYSWPSDLVQIDLSQFSPRFEGEQKLIGKVSGRAVKPYDDRELIDKNAAFEDRAKPLAWVNDPISLFFLHIQGSGKIYLETGETLNVHYHTTNGRPYRSIGKLLIDQGKIDRDEM